MRIPCSLYSTQTQVFIIVLMRPTGFSVVTYSTSARYSGILFVLISCSLATQVVSKKTPTSERKNVADNDDDDGFDVEKGIASDDMPGTPMNTTLESTEYEAGVVEDEEDELSPPPSPKKAAPTECTSRQKTPVGCCVGCAPETSPEAKQKDNNTKEQEEEGVSRKATSGVDRSSVAWCAAAAAAPTDDDDASSSSSFVATINPHLSLPTLKADGSSDYDDDDDVVFPLPSLKPAASRLMPENAVPNQIEAKPTPAPVMATMDDFDSDDDDENVCAICLNPYRKSLLAPSHTDTSHSVQHPFTNSLSLSFALSCCQNTGEGDVAVSSKYCQHLFHKDCILEWLEKNDDCPICRVEMVTAGDVDEAAKNIIGTPNNNNNNTPPASPRPPRSGPTPHQSPLLRVVQALRSSSSASSDR